MEIRGWANRSAEDVVIDLGGSIVTGGQNSTIMKGILVDRGAGKEGRWIDMTIEGFQGPILINIGRYGNQAGLRGVVDGSSIFAAAVLWIPVLGRRP